jgi:hypothetical protein
MFSLSIDVPYEEIDKLEQEIFTHPAWHGRLLGVECEDRLKGRPAFSYLLRAGEAKFHYYLSYVVEAPFIYKHQPFTIAFQDAIKGWGYRNGHQHWAPNLAEIIPMIIHQPKEICLPILLAEQAHR